MSLENQLKAFKWISILEGISFLLLLFIAMPLKYLYDMPEMVQQVGMAHGVLFIAYVLGGLLLIKPMNWSLTQIGIKNLVKEKKQEALLVNILQSI